MYVKCLNEKIENWIPIFRVSRFHPLLNILNMISKIEAILVQRLL
jgi:hypothetical protein